MQLGDSDFAGLTVDEWVAVGTVGAFVVATVALVLAILQASARRGDRRRSVEAHEIARRADQRAEAAESRAAANEQRAQAAEAQAATAEARADEALTATRRQADAQEALARTLEEMRNPPPPPEQVRWRLTRRNPKLLLLRNVGDLDAHEVCLDRVPGSSLEALPEHLTLQPQQSVFVRYDQAIGQVVLNELGLRWEDETGEGFQLLAIP